MEGTGRDARRHQKRARPDRRRDAGSGYRAFAVLHKDAHVLIVAKPDGLLVTMESGGELTLQDQVRKHIAPSGEPDACPAAAVHRLDRYTSGAVVFGRTERGLAGLAEVFREGKATKTYLTLVAGEPDDEEGTIDLPLKPVADEKRRMAIARTPGPEVVEASTVYRLEERFECLDRVFSLLEAEPVTGRTHQIRVHMAGIGCPVVGDMVHGDKGANRWMREKVGLARQFLHARSVSFRHPVTGKRVKAEAKLPGDLAGVLKRLRALARGEC